MSKCFFSADPSMVTDFFVDRLELIPGYQFKGILWIPEEFRDKPCSMEHVAVAVGFDGWIGHTCLMHVVIQKPEYLSRAIIREAFRYVFEDCKMNCVLGMVDSTNHAAVEFDTRIGFREVDRISQGGIDGDMIIFSMYKKDCRWIRKEIRHGEESACAA